MGKIDYASAGRRVVASIIDGIIIVILSQVLAIISIFLVSVFGLVVSYLIGFLYPIISIKIYSSTIGMAIMKIKVIKKNQSKITWLNSIVREIVFNIAAIPLLLGIIWILFDKEKQGWHDKAVNTIVVKR